MRAGEWRPSRSSVSAHLLRRTFAAHCCCVLWQNRRKYTVHSREKVVEWKQPFSPFRPPPLSRSRPSAFLLFIIPYLSLLALSLSNPIFPSLSLSESRFLNRSTPSLLLFSVPEARRGWAGGRAARARERVRNSKAGRRGASERARAGPAYRRTRGPGRGSRPPPPPLPAPPAAAPLPQPSAAHKMPVLSETRCLLRGPQTDRKLPRAKGRHKGAPLRQPWTKEACAKERQPVVKDQWSNISGQRLVVKDQWSKSESKTSGPRPVVKDQWSKTSGQRPLVKDQWSKTAGQRPLVKGSKPHHAGRGPKGPLWPGE